MGISLLIILAIVIGSKVMYKDNFAVITGSMTLEANTQEGLETDSEKQTQLNINFPTGFNKDNCVVISFGTKVAGKNYSYGVGDKASYRWVTGSFRRNITLGASTDNSKIQLSVWQLATTQITIDYKIVLMKI